MVSVQYAKQEIISTQQQTVPCGLLGQRGCPTEKNAPLFHFACLGRAGRTNCLGSQFPYLGEQVLIDRIAHMEDVIFHCGEVQKSKLVDLAIQADRFLAEKAFAGR